MEYPVRINKYLYEKGYCSRRKADFFIERGEVFVNGKPAVLGQKVTEKDVVTVKGKLKNIETSRVYYAFNKPRGVVTANPQRSEEGVENIFEPASSQNPPHLRVSSVGRLDKDSRGLLLLTNDGRVVNKLLNPKFRHEKEYVVTVDKPIRSGFLRKLERGVDIEGYVTQEAKTRRLGERRFSIVLTEGKKHQIRRMTTALGYQVTDLRRVRIMNIKLGNLKEGEGRELKKEVVDDLLEKLGVRGT